MREGAGDGSRALHGRCGAVPDSGKGGGMTGGEAAPGVGWANQDSPAEPATEGLSEASGPAAPWRGFCQSQ